MLFQFSLYGFLKNQRYFEPFLLLAFLEKGLSFTQIGLLIGFREICINIMEVPTGAVADVVGRRRSMIFSFLAYIGSFVILGLCGRLWLLFAGMLLFSVGEAFRTGTHKAMIFDWLARQGRANEKTRVYGFTRSWSKLGSALCAIIAAALVFVTGNFSSVFLFCIIPYVMNIVNFMTYPSQLDGSHGGKASVGAVARTLYETFRSCLRDRPLRRLFAESLCFEGTFKVCKDYLQTVIAAAALAIPFFAAWGVKQRTAVLTAPVFFLLFVMSSWASRHAHDFAKRAGSERAGAVWLWWAYLGMFAVIAAASGLGWPWVSILAFVLLEFIQNFWRPMMISRIADHSDPASQATVLSVESQGKSLFAAAMAPLVGLAVDYMPADMKFLPVGLVGFVIAATMLAAVRWRRAGDEVG